MPLGGSQTLRDRARVNIHGNLPDTAEIWRWSVVTDTSDFGTQKTLAPINTVDANYWAVSGREGLILQQLAVKADVILVLPALTDITEHDEILYTETETGRLHHFLLSYVFDRARELDQRVAATEYKFTQT